MKKLLFLICLLMIAPLSKQDVKIRKNFDEIERIKKHLKTKQITAETFTYEAAQTGYLTISYTAFKIEREGREYDYRNHDLRMGADSSLAYFYASVYLPDESVVTEVIMFAYRDDASATIAMDFMRETHYGIVTSTMATISMSTTSGWESPSDSTIVTATIATESYQYFLRLTLDFNDAATDVRLGSVRIKYTITKP